MKDLKELASSGSICATDLIWSPGMADWSQATEIAGLFSDAAPAGNSTPPPPPKTAFLRPAATLATEVPAAEQQWYHEHEGERCGPISFDELRRLVAAGQLQRCNLVWSPGMAEWTPASQIDKLFPLPTQVEHGSAAEISVPQPISSPSASPITAPPAMEQLRNLRNSVSPHLSRFADAFRVSLRRLWLFIRRQHLGARLRSLLSSAGRGLAYCYRAVRFCVKWIWRKTPSWQELAAVSTSGTKRLSSLYRSFKSWRKPLLVGTVLTCGIALLVLVIVKVPWNHVPDQQQTTSAVLPRASEQSLPAVKIESKPVSGGPIIIGHRTATIPDDEHYTARCNDLSLEVKRTDKAVHGKPGAGLAGVELKGIRVLELKVKASSDLGGKNKNAFAGFMVDYQTAKGYTKRAALSIGAFRKDRGATLPFWGKSSVPDEFVDLGKKESYQLDLQKWAPQDWTGQIWFTLVLQQRQPDTFLTAELVLH